MFFFHRIFPSYFVRSSESLLNARTCFKTILPPYLDEELTSSDTDVREGTDVSLRCVAKGSPEPEVTWRREDGQEISIGKSKAKDTRKAERLQQNHSRTRIDLKSVAFSHDKDCNYRTHHDVVIGAMTNLFFHCHALKFQKEMFNLCCSHTKVNLPPLTEPPEPFLTYTARATWESKHFPDTYLEIKLVLSNDITWSVECLEIW
ncbi:lachesin [Nephila pilipes]|uniref:Lachesin n=1 Tax=Nephila pilipes TaxID=299642 RepID=A0A8X6N7B8_NEPPI|nr:lachesin [Nephila pilipes]